jgi:hypothetical protein
MICEICNEEDAAFTMIPTGEGLPESIGVACLARRGLELAKMILPAEEIAATLGPMFVQPPQEAPSTAQDAPGRRKRQKASKESRQAKGSAGRSPEVPATGTDE